MATEDVNGLKFTKTASSTKLPNVLGAELGGIVQENFKKITDFMNFDAIGNKLTISKQVDMPGISNIEGALSALLFNQAIIGFTAVKLSAASFENFGDTIEYDFKDALQIDASNSQNYLHNIGGNEINAVIGGTVPQNVGAGGGNFVSGGGNIAAFDGNLNQDSATAAKSASINGTTPRYIGKDWGIGNEKTISSIELWGSTNLNFTTATENITINFLGSTGVTGTTQIQPSGTITQLGSVTFGPDGSVQTSQLIQSTDNSIAYRAHWAEITVANGGTINRYIAEMEFNELIMTPVIVQSNPSPFTTQPNKIKGTLFITETDVLTENTDIVMEVSRDGGTTFTTVSLELKGAPVTGVGKVLSGDSDVSLQPAGNSIVWKITAPNQKAFDIEGLAVQGQ